MASFTGKIPTPADCFTLKVDYTTSWASNYNSINFTNVVGYVKRNKTSVYPSTSKAVSTLTVGSSSVKKTSVSYNLNTDDYNQITDKKNFTIYMTSDGTSTGTKVASKTITVTLHFDGARTEYYPIGSVSKNLTYTRKTCTISYNANGGSGAPANQTKYYGMDIAASSTIPTRTGYTFQGWAVTNRTDIDSKYQTEVYYKSGQTIQYNGDQSLLAVWKANTYTITYNANGGSGAPASHSYTYASSGNTYLSSTIPTRTGYTFLGWSLSSTATSASYSAGQSWWLGNASNYTLYAVWTPTTYTVAYNANGGSGSMSTDSIKYGSSYYTKSNTFSRTGYVFNGWNERSDGTGTSWTSYIGQAWTWTYTKSITLYAQWKAKALTVVFHKNDGGTDETLTQTFSYGVSGNKFGYNTNGTLAWAQTGQFASWDRTNYSLLGWSTNSSASTTQLATHAQVTDSWIEQNCSGATATIHLYGVWKLEGCTHTIMARYQQADGSFSNYSEAFRDIVLVGDTVSWTFEETDEYEGQSISYIVRNVVNQTRYLDIYRKQYNIVYNANDGYCAPVTKTYYYNNNAVRITSSRPSRSGYRFLGWSTSFRASSSLYQAGDLFDTSIADDIVLYAMWEKLERDIYMYDSGRLVASEFIEIADAYTEKSTLFVKQVIDDELVNVPVVDQNGNQLYSISNEGNDFGENFNGFALGKKGEVYAKTFAEIDEKKFYLGDTVEAKIISEYAMIDCMLVNEVVVDGVTVINTLVDQNGNRLFTSVEED